MRTSRVIAAVKGINMKMNALVWLVVALCSSGGVVHADYVACDIASNSTYNTEWANGQDGGSGFGAWTLIWGNLGGFYSVNSGADIRTGNRAWTLWCEESSDADTSARRTFDSALSVGQSFHIDLENGNIANGRSVGITLQNASGQNRFEFSFLGGASNYRIGDNAGWIDTGIGFRSSGMTLDFTLTGADSYSWNVSAYGGSSLGSGSGTLANSGNIDRFGAHNSRAGAGNDFMINNMSISAVSASAFSSIAVTGSTVWLSVTNLAVGITNDILRTPSLIAPSWTTAATFKATGNETNWSETLPGSGVFYRVQSRM